MGWRVFQFTVFILFQLANIYYEWDIPGLAACVMGGMLAYYLTGVVLAVGEKMTGRKVRT